MDRKVIVVGISGASGAPLALECLRELRKHPVEIHLLISESALLIINYESEGSVQKYTELADHSYSNDDMGAALASGSFHTDGMIILPCSMKTVAGIVSGYTDNLLLRAADVTIKEQRPLLLGVRESPLSRIHLKNMLTLSEIPGVYLVPPLMTFYQAPDSIETMVRHYVARVIKYLGINSEYFHCWNG